MDTKDFEVIYPNEVSRNLYETADRYTFFQSDYFRNYFTDIIENIGKEGVTPIVSCDIFDTVLLRNDKSEPYRFYEIAVAIRDALHLEKDAYEVLLARFLGTEISYAASKVVKGCREGSLYDIHKVMLRTLNVPADRVEESIEVELEYEKYNLTLNVGLWDILKKLKDEDKIKIIFTSDTYKHDVHIDDLLKHFLPVYDKYIENLYSSANITISKHSSQLFEYVEKDTGYSAKQFIHIGDNLQSDYQNAKEKGWNAMFLPIPKYQQKAIRESLISFKKKLDKDGIRIKLVDRFFVE